MINIDWLNSFSIYQVHDEVKDRMFELELSWVGQGKENQMISS
jgi:hypothetical protein